MGPRASRDRLQARSPDLTAPLEQSDGTPRLVAGRCGACGEVTFPLRARCPACGGDLERFLLPPRGTLWTWTTQGFEPPSPPYLSDAEFAPFAVGYVEFADLLRVEGRLTEAEPDRLRIGMPMAVVALELGDRTTYAFAPVDE